MAKYTLTIVDSGRIQDFVFGTNNLQQIIGASYLVHSMTHDWAINALPKPNNIMHPGPSYSEANPYTKDHIEDGKLNAEVVYMGGGNFVAIFINDEQAKQFAKKLTYKVIKDAPGARILVTHLPFIWDATKGEGDALGGVNGIITKAFQKLFTKKANPPASMPILGMAITSECVFTGMPAVAKDSHGRLLSAEAEAKYRNHKPGNERLLSYLNFCGYDAPPDNLDDFGQSVGEKNYIAVVHADGNSIGKRIETAQSNFPDVKQNRDYIEAIRFFSLEIDKAAQKALQAVLDNLLFNIENDRKKETNIIPIQRNQVPFRPVVFGGDDITFISEGRLGLSLAKEYVDLLSQQTLPDGNKIGCRAGVAVVKTHFPVARAYMLAEDLCRSAKVAIKEFTKEIQDLGIQAGQISTIDWHFAVNSVISNLDTIRKQEYRGALGSLLMRPVVVASQPDFSSIEIIDNWRTWENFSAITQSFAKEKAFSERRNRVKSLREVLHRDISAINQFMLNYQFQLPVIPGFKSASKDGWIGERSGYFDAVEAMDFFIPLAPKPESEKEEK